MYLWCHFQRMVFYFPFCFTNACLYCQISWKWAAQPFKTHQINILFITVKCKYQVLTSKSRVCNFKTAITITSGYVFILWLTLWEATVIFLWQFNESEACSFQLKQWHSGSTFDGKSMIIGKSNHTVHHTAGDKVLTYCKFKCQCLEKHFSEGVNLLLLRKSTSDKIL